MLLQIHVLISLIAIATGFVVVSGLLTRRPLGAWTALFLAATVLTSVTGFPLPPFGITPGRIIGVILLVLMVLSVAALYGFRLAGAWRSLYVGSIVAALYLNVFVGVVQSFQKLAFLQPLAPTQSEAPFLIVQIAVLAAFIALGVLAVIRYHPTVKAAS